MRRNAQAAALKTRDFTICIESCDKVRDLEPGDTEPLHLHLHLHLHLLAALLTKVLELEPGDTKSLFRRALARWRLGDCEEASEDLEQILKVSELVRYVR